MTYLVMECHPSYAIVLDNEGRMIKAANLGYQEGQVVGEIIARQTPKAPILFRLAPLAAAACLCLAVLGGGAYGAYGMPYGTVEVRINPDVKMSVSYMDRVVGLEGVNEDGKKLIDQVSYKGRDSEYMTGILVERAMEMGYLTEGGTVYVAASGGSERWKAKRADAIRTGLDTLLKDGMPVEVHVESIGKDSPPAAAPILRVKYPADQEGISRHSSGCLREERGKMRTAMVKMTGTRMSVGMTLKMMMKKMMLTAISMMKMMAMTGRKTPVKIKLVIRMTTGTMTTKTIRMTETMISKKPGINPAETMW